MEEWLKCGEAKYKFELVKKIKKVKSMSWTQFSR